MIKQFGPPDIVEFLRDDEGWEVTHVPNHNEKG